MSAAKCSAGCSEMSRVGKNPVPIPEGVEVTIDGAAVSVSGKLGRLEATIAPEVSAALDNGQVSVTPLGESKRARQMWGLTRSVINNMVVGVSQGFLKNLQIEGVGYRAAVEGRTLHARSRLQPQGALPRFPDGIEITCERPTAIRVAGSDRQTVGQVAARDSCFPQARALQGQGHSLCRRIRPAQRGQEEVAMSRSDFDKRKQRVRFRLRTAGAGRPRTHGLPLQPPHLCPTHRR